MGENLIKAANTPEIVARHEACHIVVALALGFPASGCLCKDPPQVGNMEWDQNYEANDEEVIEVAIAAYVYEVGFQRLPEADCKIRSIDDMEDVNKKFEKYKKSQRARIKERCIRNVSKIFLEHEAKIDEIAADILKGNKVTYSPEFL